MSMEPMATNRISRLKTRILPKMSESLPPKKEPMPMDIVRKVLRAPVHQASRLKCVCHDDKEMPTDTIRAASM